MELVKISFCQKKIRQAFNQTKMLVHQKTTLLLWVKVEQIHRGEMD
jgi:hypothetical protein